MYPEELQSGVVLKRSPFLVVKQLNNNEVRVYSKLHGNLTSFNFDIDEVLKLFDSQTDVGTAAPRVSEVCQCDPHDTD